MNHFYTRHTRGKHQAFGPGHQPLTGPCRTEIDLVQELRKEGISIHAYEGVGRKSVDSPWYKVITTWIKKERSYD